MRQWPRLLTTEQAKSNYPVLWRKVLDLFPDDDEVKRTLIVSLVIGTCGSCRESDAGCQCWNDEQIGANEMTLDELETICAAATPGPWFVDSGTLSCGVSVGESHATRGVSVVDDCTSANAEFFVVARAAMPELVRRLKRLREVWPLERFDDNDFCIAVDETGIHCDFLRDLIHGDL